MSRLAAVTVSRAAAMGAPLPKTLARSSSARPLSSSARVCRTTCRMLITAMAMSRVMVISLTIIGPSV
jgi:hypothetical protein